MTNNYSSETSANCTDKLFNVELTKEEGGVRLAMSVDKTKLLHPEVKSLVREMIAQQLAKSVSEYADKHGHLPEGEAQIADCMEGLHDKVKIDFFSCVGSAAIMVVNRCFEDDELIRSAIDRAAELANCTKKGE